MVDERPLAPSRGGKGGTGGVDRPECVDSLRKIDGPGDPYGAFVRANVELVGDTAGEPRVVSNLTAVADLRLGDIDLRPSPPLFEKLVRPDEGGCNRSGNGNNGPLSFFRLLNLKKVVVVEMVCVVVV